MADDAFGFAIRHPDSCGPLLKCSDTADPFVSCCPHSSTCFAANDNTYVRERNHAPHQLLPCCLLSPIVARR